MRLPQPADPAAAQRLRERFAALGAEWAAFAERQAELLEAIGGNSPYLADLALREPGALVGCVEKGAEAVAAAAFAQLEAVPPSASRAVVAAAMRRAKRVVALAVAVADITGAWRLAEVTAALTRLAESALRLATAHLLGVAGRAGELRWTAAGSGFAVLGMGKLGAGELNYSSDIDLILLYDPEAHPGLGAGLRQSFTRLARGLATLMEARDADGYVFRTDFRLRPDPAATPPALSLPAAIAYYESMGQNWERAAMIKARPVAGDVALGAQFLEAIRPFVWRRGLDFAAVADIHAMKRRVDAHKGTALRDGAPVTRALGHDVKLGQGGIREVEFLAQTLQLVWGGRDPSLREPTTVGALRVLARVGRLGVRAAGELMAAYRFLRRVEHRLQMVADQQTHRLPGERRSSARLRCSWGMRTARPSHGRCCGTWSASSCVTGRCSRRCRRRPRRGSTLPAAMPRRPGRSSSCGRWGSRTPRPWWRRCAAGRRGGSGRCGRRGRGS